MITIIAILAGMLLSALAKAKAKAQKIKCTSNLKNVGLGFRIFATDNGDLYPMSVPDAQGGSASAADLRAGATLVYRHFLSLSNELQTPKIVLCPSDGLGRVEAVNWSTNRTRGANALCFAGNSRVILWVSRQMKPSPRACSQVTVTSPIRIAPISARELSSVSACVLAVTIPPLPTPEPGWDKKHSRYGRKCCFG